MTSLQHKVLYGLPEIHDSHECYGINSANVEYYEFSCLYSKYVNHFYFSFEKYYDPMPVLQYMQYHPSIPIVTCLLYVILIFGGQYYLSKSKKPVIKYKYTLATWNFVLSTFSTIGMIRTLPQLVHNLMTYSLQENVCLDPRATYGSGSTGLWIQLFVLSKFPELIDTLFIVIHQKPLLFLHWYHHITVLLYCWHSYVTKSPTGIFFVVMNYSVHASMYAYYGLMALRLVPKWFNPIWITIFQISQMIVGVIVTCIGFYYYHIDKKCGIQSENNIAAFIMYGSYLFLFVQFFLGRYYTNRHNKKQHDKKMMNVVDTTTQTSGGTKAKVL